MSAKKGLPQFVDTNIFLYAYDRSSLEKHHAAKLLINDLWTSRLGRVSIQVLQELYVNLTRKIPHPLSKEMAKQIVSDLGQWKYHVPDLADIREAINLENKHRISFWDAMIICSAKQMNCSILWTEDLNAGQRFQGVEVKNPFVV